MDLYVVYTCDADLIDRDPDALAAKSAVAVPGRYDCYQPSAFAKSSGLARTVRDELDFVLQARSWRRGEMSPAQPSRDAMVSSVAQRWQLDPWLDHDVDHLSGGWEKLLGLALFTEMQSDIKLYADSTRQLSDRLIAVFLSNLKSLHVARAAVFWELDVSRLGNLSETVILYDLKDHVSRTKWVLGPQCDVGGDRNFAHGNL